MYVKAIIIIISILFIISLYFIFRSSINGSRVQNNRDIVDKLKDSVKESDSINSELARDSKSRRDITEQIKRDNISTGTGIDDALRIIREAKERNNTK